MSKTRGNLHQLLLAVAGFALGVAVTSAQAQVKADDLRFRATIYGWFPGISGTTEFPSGASGPSLNVNAKDLIEDLKMAFMGTFEVQSGKWGGLVDWVYSNVGGDKTGTRDFSIRGQTLAPGVTANLSLDTKTNILTLAGTYSLVEDPATSVGLVFGARMLKADGTLNWAFNGTGPAGIGAGGHERGQLDELGRDHRAARPGALRKRSALVRAVLCRCRRRRVEAHLAGDRRPRILVQLGRRRRRLALSRLRVQVRQARPVTDLQRSRGRSQLHLLSSRGVIERMISSRAMRPPARCLF